MIHDPLLTFSAVLVIVRSFIFSDESFPASDEGAGKEDEREYEDYDEEDGKEGDAGTFGWTLCLWLA